MKKLKLLLLGIVGILGLGFSSATFEYSGFTYIDGIYYKSSLGLITIIDGTGAYTMQDKNIGATDVYNFGDTLGFNNVGYFYQYGNNHGFDLFSECEFTDVYGSVSCSFPILESIPNDLRNSLPSQYSSDSVVASDLGLNTSSIVYANSDIWGAVSYTLDNIKGPCSTGFHLNANLGFDYTHFFSDYLSMSSGLKIPLAGRLNPNFYGPSWESRIDGNNGFYYLFNSLASASELYYIYGAKQYGLGITSNYGTFMTPLRCYRDVALLPNSSWIVIETGSVEGLPEEDDGGDVPGNDDIYSVGTDYYNVNKALIESAVWCYMTSGQYMDGSFIQGDTGCDALNYVDFIESLDVDVSSRYFDNVSKYGNLKFNDSSKVLYYYCLSDSLSYPFCNDLDFYSSTYLIYSIVAQGSGPSRLMYNIYGSGVNVAIENNGTGYFGYTTCNGIWCSEVSTGSPVYIETSYNEYTGYDFQYLPSVDSFNVENTSSFFFNCPYPYTKVFVNMDNKIIDYLGGTKLGRVINCPISAFRYGYRTLIFGDLNGTGYYWDGHLFNGNTPGHRALFMFFDILLSLIIILILRKFYKLLSK